MGLLSSPTRSELLTRRGGAFTAVVAMHVLAVSLLLQSKVRADEETPGQPIQVVFVQQEAPREAPPVRPQLETLPVEVHIPPVTIQIDYTPPRAITAAPAPAPPPAAAPVVVQDNKPVMLDIQEVDVLREPAPRYPRAARQARLQGKVLLWVQIDEQGKPQQVRVHQSSGHEQLDREGREAVARALFKPYSRNGRPQAATFIFPVDFVLSVRTANRN
ncbi:MAG TPA: energy transducer TonB [Steroidobacteraceae bacterium]|nr:energy transducer TonB [Steroidobacteraceae bacterium]